MKIIKIMVQGKIQTRKNNFKGINIMKIRSHRKTMKITQQKMKMI
jgi:hypothetical protein